MQNLPDRVLAVFATEGQLHKSIPSFVSRPGQTLLALEIAKVVERGGQLVAEAGTGIGKTFAYLAPVLLGHQPALISTATKALQDQLAHRDIPNMLSALGLHRRVSVLKGRANYLCLERLAKARQRPGLTSLAIDSQLAQIEVWAVSTATGDLAELEGFAEATELSPWVTSTSENCLGNGCPRASDCHVNLARHNALVADIVVINHHLFFSDLQANESGVSDLFPLVATVIFDEAHRLNDIGVEFLSQQLSSRSLEFFCNALQDQETILTWGSVHWRTWVHGVLQCTEKFKALLSLSDNPEKLAWNESAGSPQGVAGSHWQANTSALLSVLQKIAGLLVHLESTSPAITDLLRLATKHIDTLNQLTDRTTEGAVNWVELRDGFTWNCGPIQIRDAMLALLGNDATNPASKKSWVFTSATLSFGGDFSLFTRCCGLEEAQTLKIDSPFDYASQAQLYIPDDFPLPDDHLHSLEVAHLVSHAARILCGRTLVLTTTVRAMREIGEALRKHFSLQSGVRVLMQGDMPKSKLLNALAQAVIAETGGVIVVATASLWEGVDVPGDALQLLVIDKIPFSSPDVPLVRARVGQLTATGRNPFLDLHLPNAALTLKQGAGRLIRTESDSGLLVVCDKRLLSRDYGKYLISELPAMNRIHGKDQWITALQRITKTSTTDPY
jgi:ATP-dependent DNA helicase DinG